MCMHKLCQPAPKTSPWKYTFPIGQFAKAVKEYERLGAKKRPNSIDRHRLEAAVEFFMLHRPR